MIIENLIIGKFISRINRFTVEFMDEEGKLNIAHLHDPGRLTELLIKNVNILVKYVPTYKKTNRKTKYDVIAIEYNNNFVLLNSGYHNQLVNEIIDDKTIKYLENFHVLKPEYSYGNSRLNDKTAKFPDAPTIRGKKHVDELVKIREDNELSTIVILILQNDAEVFSPNYETDPDFSESLERAYANDVKILPVHIITRYYDDKLELNFDKILPIQFKGVSK